MAMGAVSEIDEELLVLEQLGNLRGNWLAAARKYIEAAHLAFGRSDYNFDTVDVIRQVCQLDEYCKSAEEGFPGKHWWGHAL